MADKVLFERRGRVAIFTLNRPDQRNAVDPDVTRRMNELVTAFEADDELWVGVITGAGSAAFSSGADLKAIAAGRLAEIVGVEPGGFAGVVRGTRRKPLLAAVNGAALAGGCEIALACDLIVAADHATFGLPEVRVGIIAGAGGLQRLPRLIAPARALQMILTGATIDAREALALGLVNEVVPAERTLERTLELAQLIAANAPVAVRESLAVARTSMVSSEREAWDRAAVAWEHVLASEDAVEGPRAFSERRQPVWRGR
jgi:enoyl-CoA hydratase/carnithine racemase